MNQDDPEERVRFPNAKRVFAELSRFRPLEGSTDSPGDIGSVRDLLEKVPKMFMVCRPRRSRPWFVNKKSETRNGGEGERG